MEYFELSGHAALVILTYVGQRLRVESHNRLPENFIVSFSQRDGSRNQHIAGALPTHISASLLTFGSVLGYTAPMPIHFILPKKFTRAEIEWRVDELVLQVQGTKDRKIIAQIAALNRLLAKIDALGSDSFQPKNRQ